jgi:hypothetical protein
MIVIRIILLMAQRSPMKPPDVYISTLARRWGLPPQVLSNLFYRRVLDDTICPVVNGRRVIPGEYVPEIEQVLRDRGLIDEGRPEVMS